MQSLASDYLNIPESAPGMLADIGHSYKVSKFTVAAGIKFGTAIKIGTDTKTIAEINANTNGFFGVTLRDHSFTNVDGNGDSGTEPSLPAKAAVSILRQGGVYVTVEGAVSTGEKAYVDISEGANIFSSTATDNLYVGEFMTDAADGETAVLYINLPQN